MTIEAFFTQPVSTPLVTGFTPGYESTNLDMLLQQSRRTKLIQSNYMLDFLRIEQDPNYSRANSFNQDKLERIASTLSVTTHVMATFQSLSMALSVQEFAPSNIQQLMYNYTSLANMGSNILTNLQSGTFLNQTSSCLTNDLTSNYNNGILSFSQISQMATLILGSIAVIDEVANTSISSLLSLALSAILPTSVTSILADASYVALLAATIDDDTDLTNFNGSISDGLTDYASTTIGSIDLSQDYTSLTVSLDDPLGINAAASLSADLQTAYSNYISSLVSNTASTYGLAASDVSAITQLLQDDATDNIQNAFSKNIGLPSIASCVNGVNTSVYNLTVNTINQSFQTFSNNIIQSLGINAAPTGQKPFDYLTNLKKYLDSRAKLKLQGGTIDQFGAIDSYLSTVIIDGNVTETVVNDLYTRVNNALQDT